jgi:isopenicillin-N epimerase
MNLRHRHLVLALAVGALLGVAATRVVRVLRRGRGGRKWGRRCAFKKDNSSAFDDLAATPTLPAVDLPPGLAQLQFGSDEARALFRLDAATANRPAVAAGAADDDLLRRRGTPLTLLNHGSYGAVPRAVLRYFADLVRRVEAGPDVWFRLHSWPLTRAALQPVAELLHCNADDLVFCNNATSAVNAVLQSLDNLQANDVLLATDATYNACKLAMRHVASLRGAQYAEVVLPFPLHSDEQVLELFRAEIERLHAEGKRIRFMLVDTITSPTAVVLPWLQLAQLARAHDIRCMVDGAHGIGQLPIDLSGGDVDFFTSNLHKWCWGVKGSAVLYAHPSVQSSLRPLVTSHHHGDSFARAFWMQATREDTAYIASAVAGTSFAHALGGIERVVEYSKGLLKRNAEYVLRRFAEEAAALAEGPPNAAAWRAAAAAATAAPFICPPSMRAPNMLLLRLPFPVPSEVSKRAPLAERIGIQLLQRYGVVAPVIYENHTAALWIRFSAQIYNRDEDYAHAVACLLHWAKQADSQAALNGE